MTKGRRVGLSTSIDRVKGRLKHANKWISHESIHILQYIAPIRYIRNVTVLF